MDHRMILLMGLPRSGTTWIAKVLDSHPHTAYFHEADRRILREMPIAPDVTDVEKLRPLAEKFLDRLLRSKDAHVVGSRPQFRKMYRSGLREKLFQANSTASKAASVAGIDCPILPFVDYDRVPGLRIVWKSVISTGRLGVFVRVLKDRRAVLLLRHPCGHVASMMRGEAEHNFAYPPSEDYHLFEILLATRPALNHGLTMAHLKAALPIERLAWRWVIAYEKALEDIEGVEGCTRIRYEDICAQPEGHAKQIFAFCGLDWNRSTAEFIKSSTSSERDKYYGLFKNPLKSAMRWKSDLSERDIERVYKIVRHSDLARLYASEEEHGYEGNRHTACAGS